MQGIMVLLCDEDSQGEQWPDHSNSGFWVWLTTTQLEPDISPTASNMFSSSLGVAIGQMYPRLECWKLAIWVPHPPTHITCLSKSMCVLRGQRGGSSARGVRNAESWSHHLGNRWIDRWGSVSAYQSISWCIWWSRLEKVSHIVKNAGGGLMPLLIVERCISDIGGIVEWSYFLVWI